VRSKSPVDHLTLAFIDPTGLQMRFSALQRLLQGRKFDLLMTLQFGMGIRLNIYQYMAKTDGFASPSVDVLRTRCDCQRLIDLNAKPGRTSVYSRTEKPSP
jgi:hypothetical protein